MFQPARQSIRNQPADGAQRLALPHFECDAVSQANGEDAPGLADQVDDNTDSGSAASGKEHSPAPLAEAACGSRHAGNADRRGWKPKACFPSFRISPTPLGWLLKPAPLASCVALPS